MAKQLSRRALIEQRLKSNNNADSLIRRIVGYSTLILFVWLGFCLGLLIVSAAALLLTGGPKLVIAVWNQKDPSGQLYTLGLMCVLVGGGVGAVMGSIFWNWFVKRTGVISENRRIKMWLD